MAETILGLLVQNLNTLLQAEFTLLSGVQEDMRKLLITLSTIRDVVEDAELKQITDKPIENWLQKLKHAANDADDVLDEWHTKALQSQHTEEEHVNKSFKQKLCECLSSSVDVKQIVFTHKMGNKIRKIISSFDEIAAQKSKFLLTPGVSQNRVQYRETSSLLVEEKVYGREEDGEKIVNALLNNENREDAVSVLPIQGIGGLGKTTLAQLVYNDERVVKHFDAKGWVCVSDDFNVKRLTRMIVESYSGKSCDIQDLDPMQGQLQELLRGKKFLLVLDDVWSDDRDKWDRLKHSLTCGAKGSSIIVTTRLEKVASIVGTLPRHSLAFLSDENCWSLFKGRAFDDGNEVTTELVEIGKQIVKKCGGVPLAAKTLGGLMYLKREINEWLQVRDSQFWELPQDEGGILPALKLSYNHLPSHVRQCFSFCSIFPKDYRINKEKLIHLWMANGFVQPEGRVELEDFGNLIFNELLRRSFFQDIEKDIFGNVTRCKMHDLMHDLACSISGNECCAVEINKAAATFPKGIRHVSIIVDFGSPKESMFSTIQSLVESNPALRTLLFVNLGLHKSFDISEINFRNVNHLRALDLAGAKLEMVPATIGKMKHLRYLNLSRNSISSLPGSFSKMQNLQSLKIRGCHKLEILPDYITKLRSLRHLDVGEWITEMPDGMGQMTELQTLSKFVVGLESGRHIKELQGLNNLRGELMITRLERVRSIEDAKEANLISKHNLQSLKLRWSWEERANRKLEEKVIEEGLRPHPNLKALHVASYRGGTLPSWMPLLPNLVIISLYNCYNCKSLPPLGQLPFLKDLSLSGMKSVKNMEDEFYGTTSGLQLFPSLEQLWIESMPNLEEWSAKEDPRQAFPCLKRLTIKYCPKLRAFPMIPALHHLHVDACNEMILRLRSARSLSCLEIKGFARVVSFPEGIFRELFTSLESLRIKWCPELKSLPGEMKSLTALKELELYSCGELESLPEGLQYLSSLQTLRIAHCKSLKCLPVMGIQGLKSSLAYLSIYGGTKLTSVSKGLQHLTSLETLHIKSCPELVFAEEDFEHLFSLRTLQLEYLPKLIALPEGMQHLTRLQRLTISECEHMRKLPEWIQHLTALQYLRITHCTELESLPEGMKHLTALQSLHISNCHRDLARRCEKDKGEDWHIISHIPKLYLQLQEEEEEEEEEEEAASRVIAIRRVASIWCQPVHKLRDILSSIYH